MDSCDVRDMISDPVVYNAFESLTPRQREVLMSLVIRGERQQSLAERLNVTQQAIGRTKEQAMRKLRTGLQETGATNGGRHANRKRSWHCLPQGPAMR